MGFVIIYTNSIIAPQINELQSAELHATAEGLADSVFGDRGIPANWPYADEAVKPSLMEYVYRAPVWIVEYNNSAWNNVVISVNITVDEHAFNKSVKVYDGNKSLETNLTHSRDSDGDGLVDWMNVSFRVNVSASEKKLVYVYYSEDNTTAASYTLLLPTVNTTFNITTLGEERINGLTSLKLTSIHGKNTTYLRPRYGINRDFRVEVENVTGSNYVAGDSLPTTTSVAVHERRMLYQNRTGFINAVRATIWVW